MISMVICHWNMHVKHAHVNMGLSIILKKMDKCYVNTTWAVTAYFPLTSDS